MKKQKYFISLILISMIIAGCASPTATEIALSQSTEASAQAAEETEPSTAQSSIATQMPVKPGSVEIIEQDYDIRTDRGEEPHDIVISPAGDLAYVVAGETDNLFVIDLDANQIINVINIWDMAEVPLGPAPRKIEISPDGSQLYILAINDYSLLILDTETFSLQARIPVPGWPTDLAISPDGTQLAISQHRVDPNGVTLVDVASQDIQETLSLPGYYAPEGLAYSSDGSNLYIVTQSGALLKVGLETLNIEKAIPIPEGGCIELILNRAASRAYLTNQSISKLLQIDLDSGKILFNIDVHNANGVLLSPDESVLYASTFGFMGKAQNILMLDTQTGELLDDNSYIYPTIRIHRVFSDIRGMTFAPDREILYLASIDADSILLVDSQTLTAQGMIPLSAFAVYFPSRSVVSPDGDRLYVANDAYVPTNISVIDLHSNEVIAEIKAEPTDAFKDRTRALAVSPDGDTLYIATSDDSALLVADTATYQITGDIDIAASINLIDMVLNPAGTLAYIVDMGGKLYIMDLEAQTLMGEMETGVEEALRIKLSPLDSNIAIISGGYGHAVVDLATPQVLDLVDIRTGDAFERAIRGIGFLPQQDQFIVASHMDLYFYDLNTYHQTDVLKLWDLTGPTLLPLTPDMATTSDGSKIFLAEWDEKAVLVFNPEDWSLLAAIDLGRMPYSCLTPNDLTFSPDERELYITCQEADRVGVIDVESLSLVDVIRLEE